MQSVLRRASLSYQASKRATSTANSDLIVASNRGPVEYWLNSDGNLVSRRGGGGLVTAFSPLSQSLGFTWVSSAVTEGDRLVASGKKTASSNVIASGSEFVLVPEQVYDQYYNFFSSRILWFLQHRMLDKLNVEQFTESVVRNWLDGYVPANAAFADAIERSCSDAAGRPKVMIQDYHLYLVPSLVRRRIPDALIQHFTHIPWPEPSAWLALPRPIVASICESLLACDIVGFHTPESVRNFLNCCAMFVRAKADVDGGTVRLDDHATLVRDYPISIDVKSLRQSAGSAIVNDYKSKLSEECSEVTFVRVDRLDPSKNIVRGFQAFDLMLDRHPELEGRVRFLAFLVPSREAVPEYQNCLSEVLNTVKRVNTKHGQSGKEPIRIYYENNYEQALAGMALADVLLINSIADGMNLVAKEAPIISDRNAVLVLSTRTGAHSQLRKGVIPVNPLDIEETAEALYAASRMTPDERSYRRRLSCSAIEKYDIHAWVAEQLEDLESLEQADGNGWFLGEPFKLAAY